MSSIKSCEIFFKKAKLGEKDKPVVIDESSAQGIDVDEKSQNCANQESGIHGRKQIRLYHVHHMFIEMRNVGECSLAPPVGQERRRPTDETAN